MKIIIGKDYEEMSHKAANLIFAQVTNKPNSVLGLATGSSPIGIYDRLVELYKAGEIDFSNVTSVNLDEYRGLSGDNDQSYRYFMNDHLFNHVNIDKARTFVPDGQEPDSDKAGRDYEEIIAKVGGIDLQLLGIGHNGHIGFNEPAAEFPKTTHVVDLQESTIEANKRFFASIDEVPRQAYTMGIGTIMAAKKIVLIANGKGKAEILKKAFFGPVTPEVPASILQFHPDFTLVADEEALSECPIER